ncbi:hypothetical protein H4Q26_007502 [Puccinia striiformis f. sp. tritici PST-130]|nr:hypothetical protein H4Q26_007502 [Puccinia striiformis f. sp. tritici PST-130]
MAVEHLQAMGMALEHLQAIGMASRPQWLWSFSRPSGWLPNGLELIQAIGIACRWLWSSSRPSGSHPTAWRCSSHPDGLEMLQPSRWPGDAPEPSRWPGDAPEPSRWPGDAPEPSRWPGAHPGHQEAIPMSRRGHSARTVEKLKKK